jgi:predicted transcriptional regulator
VPRERRNPEERARATGKEARSVRRKYKTRLTTRKRYVVGEEDAICTTIAVFKIAGYSNTQIAQIVGISRNQVSEQLEKPQTQELLTLLRTNLTNAALELLESYTIEAIQALADVLRTSEDDNVRIKAAAEILDRAGIPKISRSERKVEEEHTTTFTDDGIVEALRELPPDVQEKAAQMMEDLEKLLEENSSEEAEVDD